MMRETDTDDELVGLLFVRVEGISRAGMPFGMWLEPSGPPLLGKYAKALGRIQHAVIPDQAYIARSRKSVWVVGGNLGYRMSLPLVWSIDLSDARLTVVGSDPVIAHIAVRVHENEADEAARFVATTREAIRAERENLSSDGRSEIDHWRGILESRSLLTAGSEESFIPPSRVHAPRDGIDDLTWWLLTSAVGAAWLGDSKGVVEEISRRANKTSPQFADFVLYTFGLARQIARNRRLDTATIDSEVLERWGRLIKRGAETFDETLSTLKTPSGSVSTLKMIAFIGSVLTDPVSEIIGLRPLVAEWVAANQELRASLESHARG